MLGGSNKCHTFRGGGGPYFLMLSPNLWSKIFPFTKCSGLRIFSEGGGGPYFLMLSPNLWSKIFPFTKCSGLRIFSEGGGSVLFDAESKSVVKIFPFTKRSGLCFFSSFCNDVIFGSGGNYSLTRGGQCLVLTALEEPSCYLSPLKLSISHNFLVWNQGRDSRDVLLHLWVQITFNACLQNIWCRTANLW